MWTWSWSWLLRLFGFTARAMTVSSPIRCRPTSQANAQMPSGRRGSSTPVTRVRGMARPWTYPAGQPHILLSRIATNSRVSAQTSVVSPHPLPWLQGVSTRGVAQRPQ